jgi:carboxymethylenebutenolidase
MPTYQHFVSLETTGGHMPVFLSTPEGREPSAVVLVIQGMHGIESTELAAAERLAAHGYVAAVPDLFHRGPACFTRQDLEQRRAAMSDPQVIADITQTIEYLKAQDYVDPTRIGIIGFCMGGRASYLMAATSPDIRVAADFYGGGVFRGEGGPAPIDLTANIRCPIAVFDGEEDLRPSPEDVRKTAAELGRHGIVHEVHVYPGVGHGFMAAQGPTRRSDVIEEAWTTLLAWLERPLARELVAAR